MAKKEQEPVKPANPKIKLVFVGACVLNTKKKGGVFYRISDEEIARGVMADELPREMVFGWDIAGKCGRPGTIYEFETPPDKADGSSIFGGTMRFQSRLKSDDRVLEWQVKHDALLRELDMKAREKSEKNRDLVQEQLEPLRVVYRGLSAARRAAFLAKVIHYMLRG